MACSARRSYRQRPTAAALSSGESIFVPYEVCPPLTAEAREEASHVAVNRAASATRSVAAATTRAAAGASRTALTADPHVEGGSGWKLGLEGGLGFGSVLTSGLEGFG